MKKANEPVDYLAAIEEMQREEQDKRSQIRSPEFIPQEEAVVDYTAIAKAWDKALRGRDIVNTPAKEGKAEGR